MEICFVEDVLDAMMKRAPVWFWCFLEIQYMNDSAFSFFCDFKTQKVIIFCVFIDYLIATFISFAASVISMFKNAYFNQCHFNIALLHIIGTLLDHLSIGTRAKLFLEYLKKVYDVNLNQNKIGFRWPNSSSKF